MAIGAVQSPLLPPVRARRRPWAGTTLGLVVAAAASGGLTWGLATRALSLATEPSATSVDVLVEVAVCGVGALVAGWLAVSAVLALSCLTMRLVGSSWRLGEQLGAPVRSRGRAAIARHPGRRVRRAERRDGRLGCGRADTDDPGGRLGDRRRPRLDRDHARRERAERRCDSCAPAHGVTIRGRRTPTQAAPAEAPVVSPVAASTPAEPAPPGPPVTPFSPPDPSGEPTGPGRRPARRGRRGRQPLGHRRQAPRTRRDRLPDRRVLAAVVPGQRFPHRTGSGPHRPRSGARAARRAGRGHVVSSNAAELAPSSAEEAFARGPAQTGGPAPRIRLVTAPVKALVPRARGDRQPVPPTIVARISVLRARESEAAARDDEELPSAVPSADPAAIGCSIALAALEVLAGRRPVAQLARWLAPASTTRSRSAAV